MQVRGVSPGAGEAINRVAPGSFSNNASLLRSDVALHDLFRSIKKEGVGIAVDALSKM